MDKSLKVQAQIRQNAEEVSGFLSELTKWEKAVKVKDKQHQYTNYKRYTEIKKVSAEDLDPATNPNHYANRVINSDNTNNDSNSGDSSNGDNNRNNKSSSSSSSSSGEGIESSAARHTYDVGYKKWESYDVDVELQKAEKAETFFSPAIQNASSSINSSNNSNNSNSVFIDPSVASANPAASFFGTGPAYNQDKSNAPPVPRARRALLSLEEAEAAERTRGNDEYAKGNFARAIKHYTTCMGMKKDNYVAFSNRAMVFIKQKEFARAEQDLCVALSIDEKHVKSLHRRGTARGSMGKHRAALADLELALELDPSNKAVKADIQKTKELLKSSVGHAPLVNIDIDWSA